MGQADFHPSSSMRCELLQVNRPPHISLESALAMLYLLLLVGQIDAAAAESVHVVIPGDRQIVHVLDWHYVDKATFGECHRIDGEELDRRHAQLLKEVAAVHASQLRILAPTKEVFSEGLTEENLSAYRRALRGTVAYHRELKKLSADERTRLSD